MRIFIPFFIILYSLFVFTSCKKKGNQLFENIDVNHSNISFSNRISESDTLNILKYEYIYNGSGVGLGDFNNDGLTDIYFTGNQVSNKLYLNKGNLKFEDVTKIAKVSGDNKWCSGVSLVDINSDGLLDIYVSATTYKSAKQRANLLYINKGINNNGVPIFEEQATEYGIADTTYTTNSSFFDYDNDGDLDLYVLVDKVDTRSSNYYSKEGKVISESVHRLYRNDWSDKLNHPLFVNVSEKAGIVSKGFGLGINVCDINRDGWKDIYVTNDFLTNDFFFINNHDGTFINKASDFLKHTSQSAMGNDVNDINNDGLADIIVVDMMPEDNQRKKMMVGPNNYNNYQNNDKFGFQFQYPRNTLQLNQGEVNGKMVFSEIGLMAQVAETDWSWCPMVVDFDHDGFRDIIITNGFPKDITDRDFMAYRGFASNLASTSDLLKEIPSVKIKNYAFKNSGTLTFTNVTDLWGIEKPSFSNGAAYADLDNDGDLDYVVNNINDSASVYRNNLIEQKRKDSNYLRIKFKGSGKNLMGLGTIVEISYQNGKKQFYENNIYRGYLSTIENVAHFGLGNTTVIDEIKIIWQTGKYQILKNIKTNQIITVDIKNALNNYDFSNTKTESFFSEVLDVYNINYKHKEIDAIDFNQQKLLPHKLSQYGPSLSIGDVNGDNLSDVFIGGPTFHKGSFYLQDKNGKFFLKDLIPSETDSTKKIEEDMGSLLFDADGDNDLDLYIVSGSSEHPDKSINYQDRFYVNTKGIFNRDYKAIPKLLQSGSCVKAADFDKDGDLDLFVGGRVKPGNYPMPTSSRILRNDSQNGKVSFVDITPSIAPSLTDIGLVCDAIWTDYDNDGWLDLALAGEWMPITFLKNENGKFKKISSPISDKVGWWNSITSGDFDSDGDIDYIVGNLGLNTLNRADTKFPIKIYGKDFDNNGSFDAIPSVFFKNNLGERIEYPFFGRDDMVKQMISFRKKYTDYKSFSNTTMIDVLPKEDLKNALVLEANFLQTSYIENLGKGNFKIVPLPMESQVAPVFGMVAGDYNKDGNLDIVLTGNDFGAEVGQGRMDALNGLMLLGNGKGKFMPQTIKHSGIYIPGDGKAIVYLTNAKGDNLILASQNRGELKCFKNERSLKVFKLDRNDAYALFTYKNGKIRKEEFLYGSSFLSQSERSLSIDENLILQIEIVDYKGNKRKIK